MEINLQQMIKEYSFILAMTLLAICGFYFEFKPALNILYFCSWISIGLSSLNLSDTLLRKAAIAGFSSGGIAYKIPNLIIRSWTFAMSLTFVWHGAWVTGLGWLIRLVFIEYGWQRVNEIQKEQQNVKQPSEVHNGNQC